MAQIVDGRKIAQEIFTDLREEIEELEKPPKLTVFLIGTDPASVSYVQAKRDKAHAVGIEVEVKKYDADISQADLEEEIESVKAADGIIVQLPLPEQMNKQEVLDRVSVELDVDALTSKNKTDLIETNEALYVPPAAAAVAEILDYCQVRLEDKDILIVGTGDLVGRPLSAIFLQRGLSFELANKYTENLDELLGRADVVVSAAGQAELITGERIKPGAVVIDAGTTGTEGGDIRGDVHRDSVEPRAKLISPVPGGVGPVTIAMLFKNVVKSAQRRERS